MTATLVTLSNPKLPIQIQISDTNTARLGDQAHHTLRYILDFIVSMQCADMTPENGLRFVVQLLMV